MIVQLSNILFSSVEHNLRLQKKSVVALGRLNINIIRDLLFHSPLSYREKSIFPNLNKVKNQEYVVIEIVITRVTTSQSNKPFLIVYGRNASGIVKVIFFNKPAIFILEKLQVRNSIIIDGKVESYGNDLQIIHPDVIFDKKLIFAIEPIYPLTYGITNKQLHSYIAKAIDLLPNFEQLKTSNLNPSLLQLLDALKNIHFPKNIDNQRYFNQLVFKELFLHQYAIALVRKHNTQKKGRKFVKAKELQQAILNNLGFTLTLSQEKVIAEIEQDQLSDNKMVRILQGDVGSGKTLVALLTMLNTVAANAQVVLMTPTDLLAQQHLESFCKLLANTSIKITILTAKVKGKQRDKLLESLKTGEIDILIGTHSLFQEKVQFKDLGYIVIDEQHRFGVNQRLELVNKGHNADLLVMSATPIPRSLALSLFADMDISIMADKPKNRLPIITKLISKPKIDNLTLYLKQRIKNKEKIYWICPLIGEIDCSSSAKRSKDNRSQTTDLNSRYQYLSKLYPEQVLFIHGKMNLDVKNQILMEFKVKESGILIATSVIEVGIDIPDATVIIIENAEKFGLAQLHQLRGRVGRGSLQSYCILLYDPLALTSDSLERMKIMRNSNDGFYISEQDLKLRGSGEILGVKQTGEQNFYFANVARDINLLMQAHECAKIAGGSEDYNNKEENDFLLKLFNNLNYKLINSG